MHGPSPHSNSKLFGLSKPSHRRARQKKLSNWSLIFSSVITSNTFRWIWGNQTTRLINLFFCRMLVPCREEEEVVNLHHWNIVPKETKVKCYVPARRAAKKVTHAPTPITWTVEDIYKAACLLANPPMPTSFEDEQEMRRAYTLIYDTFRCELLSLTSNPISLRNNSIFYF